MGSLIVNTTGTDVGTDFYDVAGSAISSQPKVLGGAAANIKYSALLDNVGISQASTVYGGAKVYRGFDNGVAPAFVSSTKDATVANSGGYCGYASTSHALSIGAKLYIGPSGTGAVSVGPGMVKSTLYGEQTITATGAAGFTTDKTYNTAYLSAQVSCFVDNTSANFATLTPGKYIVAHGNTYTLAGIAKTALKSMTKTDVRSTNKVEAIRTQKTSLGMQAGYYNVLTGKWTTAPYISEDGATGNMKYDAAASGSWAYAGTLTYKYANTPTTASYQARTD
jgi:hypothetical protein